MKIVFPEEPGLQGMFFTGYKNHNNQIVRTGTVVMKRTYHVDPSSYRLYPLENGYPVFLNDCPFNLVKNGDFKMPPESNIPANWKADGAHISKVPAGADFYLHVEGQAGSRITQTIETNDPLGGREFVLSFSAKASGDSARIEGVRLESDGNIICSINADMTPALNRFHRQGAWPSQLTSKKMDIVLRMSTDANKNVDYTKIQVEEGSVLTGWDPESILRYEHDLAACKKEADIIVPGFPLDAVHKCLKVNGITWFEKVPPGPIPPDLVSFGNKILYGWEPRTSDVRKPEAGPFPPEAEAYPMNPPLPGEFDNKFYNGYCRLLRSTASPGKWLFPGDAVTIENDIETLFGLTLPVETYGGTYFYTVPALPDTIENWGKRDFPMRPDTLVIDAEQSKCYIVWRGDWLFDEHADDLYRLLEIKRGGI